MDYRAAGNPIEVLRALSQVDLSSGNKAEAALELLRRKEGATTAEIAKATGWQNHTIRAFISAFVVKKMALRSNPTRTRRASDCTGSFRRLTTKLVVALEDPISFLRRTERIWVIPALY